MWNSGDSTLFRRNHFDSLRLAFSIVVLFSHSFALVTGRYRVDPLYEWTHGAADLGELAVNGFFVISGFLVARSWSLSSNWRSYLAKRAARIYPGFIVVMLVQGLLLAPWVVAKPPTWYTTGQFLRFSSNILTLTGYGYPYGGLLQVFPNNPIPWELNGSLWTLRLEVTCYLLLAGFALLVKRNRRMWSLVLLATVYLIHSSGWTPPWHRVLTAVAGPIEVLPRMTVYFALGTVFWLWRTAVPRSTPLAVVAAAGFLLGLFVPHAARILIPPSFSYLVFWCAYLRPADHPFSERFGDWSYGTYLYAFPIQQTAVWWLGERATPFRVFSIALPATLLAAALSWHWVERRFIVRLRAPTPPTR